MKVLRECIDKPLILDTFKDSLWKDRMYAFLESDDIIKHKPITEDEIEELEDGNVKIIFIKKIKNFFKNSKCSSSKKLKSKYQWVIQCYECKVMAI